MNENANRSTGTVSWVDENKGIGCIVNESGEEVTLDCHDVLPGGTLKPKQRVTYEEVRDDKGLFATYVQIESRKSAKKHEWFILIAALSLITASAAQNKCEETTEFETESIQINE